MALQIDQVASPLLTTAVAAKDTTAATATQGGSSFQSLLADSSATQEPATTTTATESSSSAGNATSLSDFELLFGGANYNAADPMAASRGASTDSANASAAGSSATTAATDAPPTAQSVFGPDVWMTDPIGLNPDKSTFEYNPIYFATQSTAQTVAQMVGGTVFTEDVFSQPVGQDPFVQQQPNYMVKMPNGAVINPGLVASFYTFGFSQSQIDTMIAQEVANTPAPTQTT